MISGAPFGRTRASACVVLVLGGLVAGCSAPRRIVVVEPGEDVFDQVTLAPLDPAAAAVRQITTLPPAAYAWQSPAARPVLSPQAWSNPKKISPTLRAWLADSAATKVDTLLISFASKVRVPRFPDPDVTQDRMAPVNVAWLDSAETLIAGVESARDSQYTADSLALTTSYGVEVLERYWITQAMRVRMPLGRVDTLAMRPNVVFIQRDRTGVPPPAYSPDGNDKNDIGEARALLVSDRLRDNPLFAHGWISLLDTGVRSTHDLFQGTVSPFNGLGDCVDGGLDCSGGTATDVSKDGHGTAAAAILASTGGSPTLDRFTGVTSMKIDAFRVYAESATLPDGELIGSAALRGLQKATAMLDRVIVCEIQDYTSSDAAAICDAADQAYGAGAVVVAAVGNFTAHPLGIPATARRVLAIGALDVQSGTRTSSQSYGRTIDGRPKPDLQARTSTESAGNDSDQDVYFLGGTSGAVPYAGGAAALVRNWIQYWRGGPVDPGQVNAHLILAGQVEGPYLSDGKNGAGEIVLPSNGWAYLGKVQISDAYPEVAIDLPIAWPDIAKVEVALWWPETMLLDEYGALLGSHNDINFELLDDGGSIVAEGESESSVFERSSAPVALSVGTWKLRIFARSLGYGPQTVYWTAAMRR